MNIILYLLTTEGFSREDGNVYYARHLVVQSPFEDKGAIDEALAEIFSGHVSHSGVEFYDPEYTSIWDDNDKIIARLQSIGLDAFFITPTYVTKLES